MEKNARNKVFQLGLCAFLICVIWVGYFACKNWIEEEEKRKKVIEQEVEMDTKLLCEIENVKVSDGCVSFEGWIFYLNERCTQMAVVLHETEGEQELISFGELGENRREIGEYYLKNPQGNEVDFCVEFDEKEISSDKCYEILVSLSYKTNGNKSGVEEKKVSVNRFYYNGEVYEVNPVDYEEPQIDVKEVNDFIEMGQARICDTNEGFWIYQYEDRLLYVIDSEKHDISSNTDMVVPVMINSTRLDLLPEEMRTYGYEHLGLHSGDELFEDDMQKYQIVEIELPKKYPVTYLNTGIYDNGQKLWIKRYSVSLVDWREYEE